MLILEKRSPLFNDLKFVLKALAKDKARPLFSKVQIEDSDENCKMLVCTDTKRMHIMYDHTGLVEGYENGQYDVIKNDAKQIILNYSPEQTTFPNFKQIIPAPSEHRADFTAGLATPSKIFKFFYKTFPESSLGLNMDFINDAIINGRTLTVQFNNQDKYSEFNYMTPMLLEYDQYLKAVIMPIMLS